MELNEINERIRDLQALKISRSRGQRFWKPYLEKYHCDVICEIGVENGYNFDLLIEHGPKLAVAIDPWRGDGILSRSSCVVQEELDRRYELFKRRMADKPFVKIYRGLSFNVVKEFEDESFDFIFIDADHTYEAVAKDIADWYPKVKKGGIFCGHDYIQKSMKNEFGEYQFGVIRAVDEFVKKNNITIFFKLPISTWGVIKI